MTQRQGDVHGEIGNRPGPLWVCRTFAQNAQVEVQGSFHLGRSKRITNNWICNPPCPCAGPKVFQCNIFNLRVRSCAGKSQKSHSLSQDYEKNNLDALTEIVRWRKHTGSCSLLAGWTATEGSSVGGCCRGEPARQTLSGRRDQIIGRWTNICPQTTGSDSLMVWCWARLGGWWCCPHLSRPEDLFSFACDISLQLFQLVLIPDIISIKCPELPFSQRWWEGLHLSPIILIEEFHNKIINSSGQNRTLRIIYPHLTVWIGSHHGHCFHLD